MGFFSRELVYVLILALGSMVPGQVMGFGSPTLAPITAEFGLSETLSTIFNAIAPFSALVGGPATNPLIKYLGKKKAAFTLGVIMIISWIFIFVAKKDFYWLAFVGRSMTGMVMGGVSGLLSTYIVEISPTEYRGAYGTLHQLGTCLGAAYSFLLGIFCTWRQIAISEIVFSCLHILLIWFVPESPVSLAEKANKDAPEAATNSESLFQRKFLSNIIHSFVIIAVQQFCGINAIIGNVTDIFKESNIALDAAVAAFLVGFSQTITTAVASPLIERFGRRVMWVISSAGQAIALLLVWAHYVWDLHPIIPVICLFLDVFSFGAGFGPIPWITIPELFPDSVRAIVTLISAALNWVLAAVVMFIWPPMASAMGLGWAFFVFMAISAGGVAYGIWLMPETKGASLGGDNIMTLDEDKEEQVDGETIIHDDDPITP